MGDGGFGVRQFAGRMRVRVEREQASGADRTLREIERRREILARRLRKASNEIVSGELAELPRAAA